jgi:hypothetical protein
MARSYSDVYKSTLAEVSAPESPLLLLEINHPELPSPVRVVNDTQNITSNGNLYLGFSFRFVLPSDYENQLPKARIAIDNVGKDLMQWIETSDGGAGSTVQLSTIMRSRPNQIEWTMTMSMFNIQANAREVSAELGFENLFTKPAISIQYRPETCIALF